MLNKVQQTLFGKDDKNKQAKTNQEEDQTNLKNKDNSFLQSEQKQDTVELVQLSQQDAKEPGESKKKQSTFDKLVTIADQKFKKIQDYAENKADQLSEAVTSISKSIDNKVKELIMQSKDAINKWIRIKVEQQVIKALEKSQPIVKSSLKDPDMCNCVKRTVDNLVDDVWPDIVEEAKFKLRMGMQKPFIEIPTKKTFCLCLPFHFIRAKYLYATSPYNQSFWKSIKSIWWWIFFLISVMPYYGVQPCFYVFIFLCIDKSDDYQLVNYILGYKKMQFVSQGAIVGVIGYIQYYFCIHLNKTEDISKRCMDKGPGSAMELYYETAVFLLQILLLWLAYLMLPCSKQKGIPKFRYLTKAEKDKQDQQQLAEKQCHCNCARGGVLQILMIYDIITFIGSVLIFYFSINYMHLDERDRFKYTKPYLYFSKLIYGMLSFPFLIFMVPMLSNLLTKAKATAYDKNGNCVPAKGSIQIVEKDEKELQQQFEIDIAEMLEEKSK